MSETALNSPSYTSQYATFTPTAGNAQTFYIEPMGAFVPGSLILSDTSGNTKVEVSNSTPEQFAANDALWTTLTNAAVIKLDVRYSAVRVTNTGDGDIRVDLAI